MKQDVQLLEEEEVTEALVFSMRRCGCSTPTKSKQSLQCVCQLLLFHVTNLPLDWGTAIKTVKLLE